MRGDASALLRAFLRLLQLDRLRDRYDRGRGSKRDQRELVQQSVHEHDKNPFHPTKVEIESLEVEVDRIGTDLFPMPEKSVDSSCVT